MQKKIFLSCVVFCCLFVSQWVLADETITKYALTDSRLNNKVTVNAARIPLYDFLKSLTKQSGVIITIDPLSPASSIFLVVRLDQQPLSHILPALSSLLSTRQFSVSWIRQENKTESFSYHLTAPRFNELAESTRKLALDAFVEQAETLRQVALNPGLAKQYDNDPIMSLLVKDKSVIGGVKLLIDALPGDNWKKILNSDVKIFLPVEELSAESRQFILNETHESARHLLNGKVYINSEITPDVLPPTLYIEFGGGGSAYIGGVPLDNALNAKVIADWKQLSDREGKSLELTTIAENAEALPLSKKEAYSMAELGVFRIGHRFALPIIALAPQENDDVADPLGKTLDECLKTAKENRWSYGAKWNSDILLITYPAWFKTADEIVPYDALRQIQTFGDLPTTQPSLVQISKVVSSVNGKQWARLLKENEFVARLAGLRQVLLLVKPYYEITKSQGVALTPDIRQRLHIDLGQLIDFPICNHVRLRYITQKIPPKKGEEKPQESRKILLCELLDADGKLVGARGATLSPLNRQLPK